MKRGKGVEGEFEEVEEKMEGRVEGRRKKWKMRRENRMRKKE